MDFSELFHGDLKQSLEIFIVENTTIQKNYKCHNYAITPTELVTWNKQAIAVSLVFSRFSKCQSITISNNHLPPTIYNIVQKFNL